MAAPKNKTFIPGESVTLCDQDGGVKDEVNKPEVSNQTKSVAEQNLVSAFKQMKLEREAQKNWDLFYKRNATNFFKDRHWTSREFDELKTCRQVSTNESSHKKIPYIWNENIHVTERKREYIKSSDCFAVTGNLALFCREYMHILCGGE